jgi:hypothetical protein
LDECALDAAETKRRYRQPIIPVVKWRGGIILGGLSSTLAAVSVEPAAVVQSQMFSQAAGGQL